MGLGSTVTIYDLERETEIEYKLVMSEEADVAKGLISTTSPIGRALLGKQAGDTTTVRAPSGTREFEILCFRTIHENA